MLQLGPKTLPAAAPTEVNITPRNTFMNTIPKTNPEERIIDLPFVLPRGFNTYPINTGIIGIELGLKATINPAANASANPSNDISFQLNQNLCVCKKDRLNLGRYLISFFQLF